ncbi:TetR family transcriptional regulator [Acetobacter tropicalis NRIC 0312]|uniref:hypothetical protein n=1 Tax=Acetobacter tropicalis TaxID=104102 RepID=UPI002156DF6B|nr:hypothetical protein [Acetobacter tropicalis]GBR67128.1 TetR family transcriptional regulator [Acetobacter tropicalis NRIC 0312]
MTVLLLGESLNGQLATDTVARALDALKPLGEVHLRSSGVLKSVSRNRLHMLENLLARGQKSGVFRKGIDAMQLHISIAALGYYYLTNRYTGSIVFRCDLMAPEMLEKRIEFNVESILRIVGA